MNDIYYADKTKIPNGNQSFNIATWITLGLSILFHFMRILYNVHHSGKKRLHVVKSLENLSGVCVCVWGGGGGGGNCNLLRPFQHTISPPQRYHAKMVLILRYVKLTLMCWWYIVLYMETKVILIYRYCWYIFTHLASILMTFRPLVIGRVTLTICVHFMPDLISDVHLKRSSAWTDRNKYSLSRGCKATIKTNKELFRKNINKHIKWAKALDIARHTHIACSESAAQVTTLHSTIECLSNHVIRRRLFFKYRRFFVRIQKYISDGKYDGTLDANAMIKFTSKCVIFLL